MAQTRRGSFALMVRPNSNSLQLLAAAIAYLLLAYIKIRQTGYWSRY